MQNVTEAVQDELVKSLDYKLGSSNVNYIQSRKDVQYFPSSLSTFTPTTSRVARIPLTSGVDFIDPESVKIAFRVRNNSTTLGLNPGTQEPSCFIKRVQLLLCERGTTSRPSLARHSASSLSPAALRQLRVDAHQLRSELLASRDITPVRTPCR